MQVLKFLARAFGHRKLWEEAGRRVAIETPLCDALLGCLEDGALDVREVPTLRPALQPLRGVSWQTGQAQPFAQFVCRKSHFWGRNLPYPSHKFSVQHCDVCALLIPRLDRRQCRRPMP